MRTELRLTRPTAGGPARLVTRTGTFSPRLVGRTPDSARVVLVGTRATLLAGDLVDVAVTVDEGLHLELEEVAATVAYDGRGGSAAWQVDISVASGASLAWRAEPFVIADGADVRRRTTAHVEAGGELLLRDQLVLGRQHERGGRLTCHTRVAYDGTPALVEDLLLDPDRADVSVRGGHKVVDQVLLVGRRPAAEQHVMELAVPGALVRAVTDGAHLSTLGGLFDEWKRARPRSNRLVTQPEPA